MPSHTGQTLAPARPTFRQGKPLSIVATLDFRSRGALPQTGFLSARRREIMMSGALAKLHDQAGLVRVDALNAVPRIRGPHC